MPYWSTRLDSGAMDPMEIQLQHLQHGECGDRDATALALGELHFDLGRLVPVLEHTHVSRQVNAIEVLWYHRSREAVELLVPMLASPHTLDKPMTRIWVPPGVPQFRGLRGPARGD
jgi:hypothetical protein